MTISYKKLWIMCAEKEMSKAELRRQAGLSELAAQGNELVKTLRSRSSNYNRAVEEAKATV